MSSWASCSSARRHSSAIEVTPGGLSIPAAIRACQPVRSRPPHRPALRPPSDRSAVTGAVSDRWVSAARPAHRSGQPSPEPGSAGHHTRKTIGLVTRARGLTVFPDFGTAAFSDLRLVVRTYCRSWRWLTASDTVVVWRQPSFCPTALPWPGYLAAGLETSERCWPRQRRPRTSRRHKRRPTVLAVRR